LPTIEYLKQLLREQKIETKNLRITAGMG
jgi:hypothetical protein